MATLFEHRDSYMTAELIETPRTDTNPLALLNIAIQQGCDPDKLDKLIALQERWEANQARKRFSEAMHACQQEMPRVGRDRVNTQTSTRYATLEHVQAVSREIYSKHGFSLSYGEADCPVEGLKRTVCDVRHTGGHCERYHLDLPLDGVGAKGNAIGSMNRVQAAISTTSYGQRRLLCMIFNITLADEDDDAQAVDAITDEQHATIDGWLNSTGTNVAAFLKWAGAESLAKFPASKYADAIQFFQRKAGQR